MEPKYIDELEDYQEDIFLLIDRAKSLKEKNRLFETYKRTSKAIIEGKTQKREK